MDVPDKKKWHRNWSEAELKELVQLATKYRHSGAINDEAAFIAAEYNYQDRTSPFMRRS